MKRGRSFVTLSELDVTEVRLPIDVIVFTPLDPLSVCRNLNDWQGALSLRQRVWRYLSSDSIQSLVLLLEGRINHAGKTT